MIIFPLSSGTGDDDPDRDSVFYRVLCGTTYDSVSVISEELTTKTIEIGSENKLVPSSKYYWRVIGYSKAYAYTVWSPVFSFTSADKPKPDLVIDTIVMSPAAPAVVDSITFSFTVKNMGIEASSASLLSAIIDEEIFADKINVKALDPD